LLVVIIVLPLSGRTRRGEAPDTQVFTHADGSPRQQPNDDGPELRFRTLPAGSR